MMALGFSIALGPGVALFLSWFIVWLSARHHFRLRICTPTRTSTGNPRPSPYAIHVRSTSLWSQRSRPNVAVAGTAYIASNTSCTSTVPPARRFGQPFAISLAVGRSAAVTMV